MANKSLKSLLATVTTKKEDRLPSSIEFARKMVDGAPTLVAQFSAWDTKRTLFVKAPLVEGAYKGLVTWLNAKDDETASVGAFVGSIDEEAATRQLEAAKALAQVGQFGSFRVLDTCGKIMVSIGSDSKEYDLYRTMGTEGPIFKAFPALNEFQKAARREAEALGNAEDC